MTRLFLGLFLLAHGLIHMAIWLPQAFSLQAATGPDAPFDPGHSWVISGFSEGGARWLSVALALVATAVYVGAGASLFASQPWWRPLTIAASVASLTLLVLYFTPWLSAAVLIDVMLLLAVLWAHWPSVARVGA
jgi:hypothetical protein